MKQETFEEAAEKYSITKALDKHQQETLVNLLEYIRNNCIETSTGWQMNGKDYSDAEIIEQFKNK